MKKVAEKSNKIAESISDANIPYRGRGPNSNTAAAVIYEKLTGEKAKNNSELTLPGLPKVNDDKQPSSYEKNCNDRQRPSCG